MAQVDAEYVIDIAANMGGGEKTIAELDALTEKLTGAGKNAEFFQAAIKKASADLQTAAAASASAASALAEGNAKYAELEQAAAQASKQVEKLGKSGGLMSREYIEAAQKSHAAALAVNEQAVALGVLEKNATHAATEEERLGKTLDNVKKLSGHADKAIAAQAESLEKLASGVGAIPGPVGDLGQALIKPIQGFTKLSASMGESNAAALLAVTGFAAVAVAIAAITAAVVVGAVKIATWAIGMSDAARAAGLASDAFNILNPEVSFLGPKIDELAGNTAVAKKDLQGLAASLAAAGVSTDKLADALEAAALAESGGGKEASAKYIALEKSAADARKAVADFAKKSGGAVSKELTDKLAEAEEAASGFSKRAKALRTNVDKQLMGVGKQTEKLQKNFGELFSGLNTDSVERGLKIIVDLFDKNTEAGRAMQMVFETVFQPLIDQAENAAVVVEAFVLGFLIGAVKLYIKLKPVIEAIGEFFGFDDTSLSDTLDMVAAAGEYLAPIVLGIIAAFGAFVAVIGTVVGVIAGVIASFIAIPNAVAAAGAAVGEYFGNAVSNMINYVKGLDFAQIGIDMMTGLANGIVAGGAFIVNAITGAVGSAINAAKSMLGIHSPSKVFENFGDLTGEGFVQGVEAQNDNAQTAMADMVAPELPATPFADVTSANTGAPAATPAAADGGSAPAAGGASVTVNGNTFNFYGVKDAEHAQQLFEESMTKMLKGDAAALGNSLEERAA